MTVLYFPKFGVVWSTQRREPGDTISPPLYLRDLVTYLARWELWFSDRDAERKFGKLSKWQHFRAKSSC